jgi:tetratricopeptide (TPR) repeat protein
MRRFVTAAGIGPLAASAFAAVGAAFLIGSLPLAARASGGSSGMGGLGMDRSTDARRSPEQIARARYEKGLQKRDSALDHEKKAAAASSDEKRAQETAQAKQSWEGAIADYQSAIEKKSDFHEAYSDLGYAYRKLGRYPESLAAYDKALELKPNYPKALEYEGEAYLGLNRIDDARRTYMKLFSVDRAEAGTLMKALAGWADRAQAQPPAGIDAKTLEEFLSWVRERRELAAQAGEASSSRSW